MLSRRSAAFSCSPALSIHLSAAGRPYTRQHRRAPQPPEIVSEEPGVIGERVGIGEHAFENGASSRDERGPKIKEAVVRATACHEVCRAPKVISMRLSKHRAEMSIERGDRLRGFRFEERAQRLGWAGRIAGAIDKQPEAFDIHRALRVRQRESERRRGRGWRLRHGTSRAFAEVRGSALRSGRGIDRRPLATTARPRAMSTAIQVGSISPAATTAAPIAATRRRSSSMLAGSRSTCRPTARSSIRSSDCERTQAPAASLRAERPRRTGRRGPSSSGVDADPEDRRLVSPIPYPTLSLSDLGVSPPWSAAGPRSRACRWARRASAGCRRQ